MPFVFFVPQSNDWILCILDSLPYCVTYFILENPCFSLMVKILIFQDGLQLLFSEDFSAYQSLERACVVSTPQLDFDRLVLF